MKNVLMKRLSLDAFVQWMMANHYYDVEVETGIVTNCRTGKNLRSVINVAGYPCVNLVFNRAVVRKVRVHRFIALKAWGLEAIIGKQVGHRDGVRSRSILSNLWLPNTAKEHVYADGTHRNLKRKQPKSSWLPCVECGDANGSSTGRTPDRMTGKRFGIKGQICRRCYGRLQERERRGRR